jgi:hypothetical protein
MQLILIVLQGIYINNSTYVQGVEGKQLQDFEHRLLNYKDTKAKCRHIKKLTYKGTLRQSHVGIFNSAL